jgi:hypothetical protein
MGAVAGGQWLVVCLSEVDSFSMTAEISFKSLPVLKKLINAKHDADQRWPLSTGH